MREVLESLSAGYALYQVRPEYDHGQKIPFRVSPYPLIISPQQEAEIKDIGRDIVSFFQATEELRREDETVRQVLSKGKPEIFLFDRPMRYLFVRPDLIITEDGFSICEIETSPFGLALAQLLNTAYYQQGFTTVVAPEVLPAHIQANTPAEGLLVYSHYTEAYSGQIAFLADQIFSSEKRLWQTVRADMAADREATSIYRGFYLKEYTSDSTVRLLIDRSLNNQSATIIPSLTPQLEEKAILGLFWDKRWESYFLRQLGAAVFKHLRAVIPPTWIVGQEAYFVGNLPPGIERSVDLAILSRSRRTFVLKPSGNSWSRGISFLQEKSLNQAKRLLHQSEEADELYVIQEFRAGPKQPLVYVDDQNVPHTMWARIRLTPYFSLPDGQLIAIKATGCENTHYIHATSSSINTAVAK